ncbi:MAG TPA: hypothetical protein VGD72_02620 [Mycobacteriales bacterium]|jgi:hypothetical protein
MTYADEPLPPDTSPVDQAGSPGEVDPEELAEAMTVYSADGQVDDATGGDAGAEAMRARDAEAGRPHRPSPDGPATGPV